MFPKEGLFAPLSGSQLPATTLSLQDLIQLFLFINSILCSFYIKWLPASCYSSLSPGPDTFRIFPSIFGISILMEKSEKYDFLLQGA